MLNLDIKLFRESKKLNHYINNIKTNAYVISANDYVFFDNLKYLDLLIIESSNIKKNRCFKQRFKQEN